MDENYGSIGVPSTEDVNAMKKVLEAFNNVGTSVINEVKSESRNNPEIHDLYQTAMTGKVKIGNVYEIRVREIESLRGNKKVYDIYNAATNDCISDDLFLYEAAYAIVKYLNKGYNLLSNEIRNVSRLEQEYASCRTDAGMFKVRLNESIKKQDAGKAQLYQTRYNTAKDKALSAKAELIKIAETL